jgi:uncharacterized membrane protein YagU involved in acid resistance
MAHLYHSRQHYTESYVGDKTDWKAAVWAGLIAGAVFMMVEMLMVMFFMGQSPWGPPRMIAAMIMGKGVLPPPGSFDMGIVTTAMMIHFALSVVYGLVFGWIVHRLSGVNATLIGAVFGLAIYFINFHLIAPVMFPWFTMAQNWVSVVAHLIFGLALGASYAATRHHKPVMQ